MLPGTLIVRKMGLEPTRHGCHKILSLARLPIPTLPRTNEIIAKIAGEVNTKFIKWLLLLWQKIQKNLLTFEAAYSIIIVVSCETY